LPRPEKTSNRLGIDASFDALDEEARGEDWVAEASDQVGIPDRHGHVAISTNYSRSMGRRLALCAGTLVVILAVALFSVNGVKLREELSLEAATVARTKQPPIIESVRVQYASPVQIIALPGEVRGWYRSTIYARVDGYLASWSSEIGDRVKKDQVLASIDTPDLDAQLLATQAQLKAAEAELSVKEADAEFAKTTYDRWRRSPKGAVSEQEREGKKSAYDSAFAQLNAARARVALGQANVDRLAQLTKYKQVTAPFDGVITERRVDIGDLVTAGSTKSTTHLFSMAQYDKIRVLANVPQSASIDLGIGTDAEVIAREVPKRTFVGKVTRTGRSIDAHARTLKVEVDLANDDLVLIPGMYVLVNFHIKPKGVFEVPANAMTFKGSVPQVVVIKSDDTVSFQDVSIARDNGKTVQIASEQLSENDRVGLNVSSQIVNGEKVAVQEVMDSIPTATR
jgi:RND family efflux transporter MFP subunit